MRQCEVRDQHPVEVVELVLQQLGEGLRHARPLFALAVLVGELHGHAGMALYSAEQPRQRHAVIKQREFVIGGPGDVWVVSLSPMLKPI